MLTQQGSRSFLLAALVLFFNPLLSVAAVSPLERMEGLIMPGEVIKGHERFEKQCDKCHDKFDRKKQNTLCLNCHETIAADVKKEANFHGGIHNIKKRECHTCHTEHKGRDADIVQLDREIFLHDRTSFKLQGAHRSLSCDLCHTQKNFYRVKRYECINCHEKDDLHKERMGAKCNNCHIEASWQPAFFNHKKTDFPLRANHANVSCTSCHVNQRYANTPKNCYFCHYLDDVHGGDRGVKCHECHVDERWSKIEFDHDKDTDFKLRAAHTRLLCKDCHEKNVFKDTPHRDCYTCHKIHDVHNEQYGKDCGACHDEERWENIKFKHDKDTQFPLKGEHKDLLCKACHKGHLFKVKTPKTCDACHRLDDVHDGQEGDQCTTCHSEESWIKKVVFDHDLTKFPLHGSHPLLTCEDCHASGKYKDAKVVCIACHKKDDVHKLKLGENCELCHGSLHWLVWEFDHTEQTKYPLTGAHDGLDCHACHNKPVEKKIELPKNCFGCHEKDDSHSGQLGRQCEKCHITKSFKAINIR